MDLVHDGGLEGGEFFADASFFRELIDYSIIKTYNFHGPKEITIKRLNISTLNCTNRYHCVFIFEYFDVIPKVKEDRLLSDEILADVQPGDTMVFSRGEAIALWVGVILFVAILSCVLYRLCRVTVQ